MSKAFENLSIIELFFSFIKSDKKHFTPEAPPRNIYKMFPLQHRDFRSLICSTYLLDFTN